MKVNELKPQGWVVSQRSSNNVISAKTPVLVARTQAELYENGLTYNEPGYTYNQAGATYGGVFGRQNVRPLVSLVKSVYPSFIRSYNQAGTATPVSGNSGMLIGMLGMTYP